MRLIIAILFSVCFLFLYSQNAINSPYSRFGIGYIYPGGSGMNKGMDNLGIAIRNSKHLNSVNSASYTELDSLSFIFEFGLESKISRLSTTAEEHFSNSINLSYLAIGFRITRRLYSGLGLRQFSSMNYRIEERIYDINFDSAQIIYCGSGGINQLYIDNSILLLKNLSLGIRSSYLFGGLRQTNSVFFSNDTLYDFQTEKNTRIKDFYFNFGLQYHKTFRTDYFYSFGLRYGNKTELKASRDILSGTIQGQYQQTILYNDIIDTLPEIQGQKGTICYPANIGIGFCIGKNNKWLAGMDFISQSWSEFKIFDVMDSLVNSNTIIAGFQFIPNINDFTNYLKKIRYRLGVHYTKSYLKLNNIQLNNYGISIGIGLPLRNTNTSFNISFQYNRIGTVKNNLINEDIFLIALNLTLYDNWFIKQKFE